MNKEETLGALRSLLEPSMKEKGFAAKGKLEFLRKSEPHKREELLSLDSRPGKPPHHDTLYVSMTCGIYSKAVNAADAKIEKDFINTYPLAGGSIGHYRKEGEGYFSIPVIGEPDFPKAAAAIKDAIENGAFNLFAKFPTLDSLVEGIDRKDPWLSAFHINPAFRQYIRAAAIRYVARGKDDAMAWFQKAAPADKSKTKVLAKMKKEW